MNVMKQPRITDLPLDILAWCLQESLDENWSVPRMQREYARLQFVCQSFRQAVLLHSSEIWEDLATTNRGLEQALSYTSFVGRRLPRNTAITFSVTETMPFNKTLLDAIYAHCQSLQSMRLSSLRVDAAPPSFPGLPCYKSTLQALTALRMLEIDAYGIPVQGSSIIPTLPALETLVMCLKSLDLSGAPAIIDAQPTVTYLNLHGRHRPFRPETSRNSILPWLSKFSSLQKLQLILENGNANAALRFGEQEPPLSTVTSLAFIVLENPTSFSFLRAFPNIRDLSLRVLTRFGPTYVLAKPLRRPSPIAHWKFLEKLTLQQVNIHTDMHLLEQLTSLRYLKLVDCNAHTMVGISNLTRLTSLSISDHSLLSTEGIETLTGLKCLALDSVQLAHGPGLERLRLIFLSLQHCVDLRGVPWHIKEFTESLATVRLYSDVCSDMESFAYVPRLNVVELYGENEDGVGMLLESIPRSRCGSLEDTMAMRFLRWGKTITPFMEDSYPRAAEMLRQAYVQMGRMFEGTG